MKKYENPEMEIIHLEDTLKTSDPAALKSDNYVQDRDWTFGGFFTDHN